MVFKKHSMWGTSFYTRFYGILNRCNNPNAIDYKWYGGRGIRCDWRDFEHFKEEMFDSYQEHVKVFGERNTTIERINNDGNYCKSNCRWATWKEQRAHGNKGAGVV